MNQRMEFSPRNLAGLSTKITTNSASIPFTMSIFRVPVDVLELMVAYLDDPVSYSWLRASCREGHALLSSELSVSFRVLEVLRRRFHSLWVESSAHKRFRISDGLSLSSIHRITFESPYQMCQFLGKFSVDEFRKSVSESGLRECLEVCADRGLLPVCAKLLEALDDRQYEDEVILYRQLETCRFGVVDIILKRGSSLRHNAARGSLLERLLLDGDSVPAVKFMLSRGVPLEEADLPRVLRALTGDCHSKMIDIMLRGHKDRDYVKSTHEFARRASELGHFKVLKVLIKYGACMDPDECLACAGDISVISFLVQNHNAIINYVDDEGETVVSRFCTDMQLVPSVGRLLALGATITTQQSYQALVTSFDSYEPIKTLRSLIRAGVDINAAEETTGCTVLHMAIESVDFVGEEVVLFLIKSGVNVDLKDHQGVTALMMAAVACSPKIVVPLISRGANVAAVDDNGHDALQYSINGANYGAERILLSHGMIPPPNPEPKRRRRKGQYFPL